MGIPGELGAWESSSQTWSKSVTINSTHQPLSIYYNLCLFMQFITGYYVPGVVLYAVVRQYWGCHLCEGWVVEGFHLSPGKTGKAIRASLFYFIYF